MIHNPKNTLKTNYYQGCRCEACVIHNSEYQKEWRTRGKYAERKLRVKEAITKAKDVPCHDCGQRYPAVCMDFDHNGQDKNFNIGGSSRSLEHILEEIVLCQVVCSNCHRIRTALRAEYTKNVRKKY